MRLRDGSVTLGVRPEKMLAQVDVLDAVERAGLTLESLTPPGGGADADEPGSGDRVLDPVCRMRVTLADTDAGLRHAHEGTTYGFCSAYCAERFRADPARYLK